MDMVQNQGPTSKELMFLATTSSGIAAMLSKVVEHYSNCKIPFDTHRMDAQQDYHVTMLDEAAAFGR